MSYFVTTPTIGIVDINAVYTAGGLGYPWASPSGDLPAFTPEQQFGQIVSAQDLSSSTAGGGAEFIFLKIPTSTAVTAGLLYYWLGDYTVTVVPAASTASGLLGFPVAVAVNAVSSNASSIQATWFQVQGRCTLLKAINSKNVAANVPLYISNITAGRVKATVSSTKSLLGLRSANTATVLSTTSTILAYIDRPRIGS